MTAAAPEFTPGQEVIWAGAKGLFSRRVRIVAPRRSWLEILGETPADAEVVYDIAVPAIKGTVYGIPASQLHPAEEAGR